MCFLKKFFQAFASIYFYFIAQNWLFGLIHEAVFTKLLNIFYGEIVTLAAEQDLSLNREAGRFWLSP